jgi:hypothetical protein
MSISSPEVRSLQSPPLPAGYQFRRFQPTDAAGIVACVRQIYGDSYVHPELYDTEAICRLNDEGELVSVIATGPEGDVVGHYALERPDLGRLAETGEALVVPEHRHHQLMENMRTLLEQHARKLALKGLFGNVVTNHVFSQRVVERFAERPCAVTLGWSPKSFHNMSQSLPQRMSELVYFKHLDLPEETVVYLPERHRLWCLRIYEQLSAPIKLRNGSPTNSQASGCLRCEVRSDLARANLRIQSIGCDTASAIRDALASCQQSGIEAVFLDLPLADPGAPALCEQAESMGFFFSGICPLFASTGDVLRLQWLGVELDESLLQIESPLARELLGYVAAERRRIARLA